MAGQGVWGLLAHDPPREPFRVAVKHADASGNEPLRVGFAFHGVWCASHVSGAAEVSVKQRPHRVSLPPWRAS